MPKVGAEPQRRQALIEAAIEMIGETGSIDVPVKRIAERAGMSSALAFHYFGGKDGIIIETMRYLLRSLSETVIDRLRKAKTPSDRLDAVIEASFADEQFDRNTIAAWLVFYLHSYASPESRRLLTIYISRLRSNIVDALSAELGSERAAAIADGLGALIDGIYIRQALRSAEPDGRTAIEQCRDYVAAARSHEKARQH